MNVSDRQVAMPLLRTILSEGLIDDAHDENFWNQINLPWLNPRTMPQVRLDSLYFVMEEMEAFDEDEEPA